MPDSDATSPLPISRSEFRRAQTLGWAVFVGGLTIAATIYLFAHLLWLAALVAFIPAWATDIRELFQGYESYLRDFDDGDDAQGESQDKCDARE